MRKSLLSLGAFLTLTVSISAQVDTLANHFTSAPTVYLSDNSGYISGNNGYGDLAKMQLFDTTYGVTAGGTITNVLLGVALKVDNAGSFNVKIWENNAGQPGLELGSVNFPLSQTDTSLAAFQFGSDLFFNVNAAFNVAIPANKSFWAGIELPATAGDTIALYSTSNAMNSADSLTHSGEFWDDASFHTLGDPANWNFGIGLAVFPVVNLVANVTENTLDAMIYPNPATEVLNFRLNSNASLVEIMTMDGKVVLSQEVAASTGSISLSGLESGMYLYQISALNGAKSIGNFVKK